jgi:hypothetical protein
MNFPQQPGLQPQVQFQPGFQTQVPFQPVYKSPIHNKVTNSIISLIVIIIICIIIWLIFLKKDGKFSDWSEWSKCDKECNGGKQTRTRIYTAATWGGTDLPDKDTILEEQECNIDPCPIDGYMTPWINEGECSNQPCRGENGTQKQIREYIPAKYGGNVPYDYDILYREIDCEFKECKSKEASITDWIDIVDNSKKIIYKDNNNNIIDINSINPINFEQEKFKVYSEQKRTFIKEGINYRGLITLNNLLEKEKKNNNISDTEINLIKPNGGDQIKKIYKNDGLYFTNKLIPESQWLNCDPEKGNNRWKTKTSIYYFPTGENVHHSDFNFNSIDWTKINNLTINNSIIIQDNENNPQKKYKFTRINEKDPKKYKVEYQEKCESIPYHRVENLQKLWKLENIVGCTSDFKEELITNIGGKPLVEYSYSKTGMEDLEKKILLWSKENIIKENEPRKKIIQCYGDNYTFIVTPEIYKLTPNKNILQSGFTYTWKSNGLKNDFEWFTSNGKIKLVFQYDGHLILRGNITNTNPNGNIIWKNEKYETSDFWKGKWTLQMQFDGNLTIRNGRSQVWSTNTYDNPGSYAELLNTGAFIIRNKNNKNICYILRKRYGDTNIYFRGGKNWKYVKNNSTSDILSDWRYYDNNGNVIERISKKVTLANDTQPWGMTEKDFDGDVQKEDEMNKPMTINGVNNVVHIVLLNKLGERIYIEPTILQKVYTKNSKDNPGKNTISCSKRYYNAIPAYNGNDLWTDLYNSSIKLERGLFNNEKGRGKRAPYNFYKDFGAWAWSPNNDTCTEWYNLAFDGNTNWKRVFDIEKTALEDDGFKPMNNDIYNSVNWLRDPRGDSEYSRYWRIYYRTMDNYVKYLNSSNSQFTNKSMFNNKFNNDLENFINYRINKKNKSNFSNILNNSYLETIMY